MSPVRGHGHYKRPWHLTYFDRVVGKSGHAEFHWERPATALRDQLLGMPTRFENVALRNVAAMSDAERHTR